MDQALGVTFSNGQLAIIVLVLAGVLAWALRFGFSRLIHSIDDRFDKLEASIKTVREEYAPRAVVDAQFSGVHRRVDDLRRDLHRRRDDPSYEE
ncbi:MAG: hypothetical protein JST05_01115 [Acidobacteria bacterium]|nr:hypothetical protein [Acidobacteriota bacterium]